MSDRHYTSACSRRTGNPSIRPCIVPRWSFRLLLKLRKSPAFQTVRCQTLSYWQSLCSTHGKRFIFIMLLYTSYTLLTKFAIDYLWLLNAWYPAYCCPILARGPRSASADHRPLVELQLIIRRHSPDYIADLRSKAGATQFPGDVG